MIFLNNIVMFKNMYGFYGNLGVQEKKMDDILNFIVKMRCDLAHGNLSFSDASSNIIWNRSSNATGYNTPYISDRLIRESRCNQSTEFYGGYCKPCSENDIPQTSKRKSPLKP